MTDLHPPPAPDTLADLRAARRVFDLARQATRGRPELAAALATSGLMARLVPDQDEFRGALTDLADRHPEFAPALAEYARRRPDDDPWRDCGAAD